MSGSKTDPLTTLDVNALNRVTTRLVDALTDTDQCARNFPRETALALLNSAVTVMLENGANYEDWRRACLKVWTSVNVENAKRKGTEGEG